MRKTKRGFKDTGYVPILNLGGEGVLKTKHFLYILLYIHYISLNTQHTFYIIS